MTLVFVLATCATGLAEDIKVAGNLEQEANKKEVLTPLQQQMQKMISITFRETPIDDVIRAIAEKANVDILKSPQVTGTVTATLTDVPLGEALDNILASHGYGYVADKNIIRIAPLSELAQKEEVLVNRVYRITYADVKDVEKALDKFISKRGSLSCSPSTSNIIVTDTESKIKTIDTFIEEIDRITPQVLVEARIYDITSQDKLDLGVQWQAGRRTTYDETSGTGTIGVNPSDRTDPFITGVFSGATSKTSSVSGNLRIGWLNASIDIDAMIKAQQNIVNAKLLANPRILVLDNETADFDIVREIPYKQTSTTGNTATETVIFKPVGTKLQVTPHVTKYGMLRLRIVPEFGVVVGTLTEGSPPTVDTRKVDTIALVKDGQTVVIGGLRKKEVSQQTNKIPLLGDIPVLGALFRFEGEDITNSELVVFITPRIVEQPVLSEAEQQAYEETEFSRPAPVQSRMEKETEAETKTSEE
jgi:type IV pilus assembly protein PilQ